MVGMTNFFWRNNEILLFLSSNDRMKATINPSIDCSYKLTSKFVFTMIFMFDKFCGSNFNLFDHFDDVIFLDCTVVEWQNILVSAHCFRQFSYVSCLYYNVGILRDSKWTTLGLQQPHLKIILPKCRWKRTAVSANDWLCWHLFILSADLYSA